MARKISHVIAAGLGALAFGAAAAVYADGAPSSVNESAPVSARHGVPAPTASGSAVGRSGHSSGMRDVRGPSAYAASSSGTFEVQTPSSVNESAPWLTGQRGSR